MKSKEEQLFDLAEELYTVFWKDSGFSYPIFKITNDENKAMWIRVAKKAVRSIVKMPVDFLSLYMAKMDETKRKTYTDFIKGKSGDMPKSNIKDGFVGIFCIPEPIKTEQTTSVPGLKVTLDTKPITPAEALKQYEKEQSEYVRDYSKVCCDTCIYFGGTHNNRPIGKGSCRHSAPTANGFPLVHNVHTFCGSHTFIPKPKPQEPGNEKSAK